MVYGQSPPCPSCIFTPLVPSRALAAGMPSFFALEVQAEKTVPSPLRKTVLDLSVPPEARKVFAASFFSPACPRASASFVESPAWAFRTVCPMFEVSLTEHGGL